MNRINEIVNNTFNILANKIINEIANNMVVRAMVHGDNNNKQWQSQAQMVVCFTATSIHCMSERKREREKRYTSTPDI